VWGHRRIVVGKKKRVAVGRRLHGSVHTDGAAGSCAVFDEDLLSERARQRRATLARGKTQRTACSEWHNETNRPGRPHLCPGGRKSARKGQAGNAFNEAASSYYSHAVPSQQEIAAGKMSFGDHVATQQF
jgi:hypothetical protein